MARKISILLAMMALGTAGISIAQTAGTIELYKSPYCGCCGKWAEHMTKAGFSVKTHEIDDVPATRKKLGMPEKLGSCHTAKIGSANAPGGRGREERERVGKR